MTDIPESVDHQRPPRPRDSARRHPDQSSVRVLRALGRGGAPSECLYALPVSGEEIFAIRAGAGTANRQVVAPISGPLIGSGIARVAAIGIDVRILVRHLRTAFVLFSVPVAVTIRVSVCIGVDIRIRVTI